MSISAFMNRIYQHFRWAIVQHPLEILFAIGFAMPFGFIQLHTDTHRAYWLFAPIFFVTLYLSRSYKFYPLAWFIPIIGIVLLAITNSDVAFYYCIPKFWGLLLLVLFCFCVFHSKR